MNETAVALCERDSGVVQRLLAILIQPEMTLGFPLIREVLPRRNEGCKTCRCQKQMNATMVSTIRNFQEDM